MRELDEKLIEYAKACYFPHPTRGKGKLFVEDDTVFVSPLARIDLTANVTIGSYSMIGENTTIFTHDHFHEGRDPLIGVQLEKGVKFQDKIIGKDVWLHGCTVLYQVTLIPDGVVIGAGSVLTKNPGSYEIWAGNPAIKIGERSESRTRTLPLHDGSSK